MAVYGRSHYFCKVLSSGCKELRLTPIQLLNHSCQRDVHLSGNKLWRFMGANYSLSKESGCFPAAFSIITKRSLSSSSEQPTEEINGAKNAIEEESKSSHRTVEEVKEDLRQLHHIRALVSQLHQALHDPAEYQSELESLQKQLETIRAELQPLEERKLELLSRAERRSNLLAWAGLGFMGMQFGFLARLTWWEYSWDIIEPVTYFVTYGTAMVLYAYFLVTRQDYSFPAVTERWTAVAFHKNAKRKKWEMERYVQLREQLHRLQTDIDKLSMFVPKHSGKVL